MTAFEVYSRKPYKEWYAGWLRQWNNRLPEAESWSDVIKKLPPSVRDTSHIFFTDQGTVHPYEPARLRRLRGFGFPDTVFGEYCGTGRGGKDAQFRRLKAFFNQIVTAAAFDGERPRMFRAVMDPPEFNLAMAQHGASLLHDWHEAVKNGGDLPNRQIPKFVIFNRAVVAPIPFHEIYRRHFGYRQPLIMALAREHAPKLDFVVILKIPKQIYRARGGTMSDDMFDELEAEHRKLPLRIAKLVPDKPIVIFEISGVGKRKDVAHFTLASIGTVLRDIL